MKKISLLLLIASLTACSIPNDPTTQEISADIDSIPANTIISVISVHKLAVPKNSSETITKLALFKTVDNTYSKDGVNVLIPRHAIIDGLYSNNGVNCTIKWKSVHFNHQKYKGQEGSLSLVSATQESVCNPKVGVKSGSRSLITFN